MNKILSLLIVLVLCVGCSSPEFEEYNLYGTVDMVEGNTVILDTTSWSSENGDIPGGSEIGTGYDLIVERDTVIVFENGDTAACEDIRKHQLLGLDLIEDGIAKEVTIISE